MAELSVGGDMAEVGVSVDRGLRRRGVGTYLIQTAARLLAQRGVKKIVAFTMPGNKSFLALSRKAGADVTWDMDEVEILFDVAELNRAYLQRRLGEQVFHRVA